MKKLGSSDMTTWNIVFAVSLLIAVVSAWFAFFAPHSTSPEAEARSASIRKVRSGIQVADKIKESSMPLIASKVSGSDVESLGSATLNGLTDIAAKRHVELSGFRSEPPLLIAGLVQAPFVVTVGGAFKDVVDFVDSLEDPKSKLAVDLLQISSADTATDRVTATVGLVGFLTPPAAVKGGSK